MTEPVICLGEYLIDRLLDIGEPHPKASRNWTDYPGGAPANVAAAIANWARPPAWSVPSAKMIRATG